MGAKTPVSILQEMMTRMGNPPKYDLIFDGSGTHTAVFKYRVYAGTVTAIGSGRSKKEAKHEAARVALEKLSTSQIEDSQPTGSAPEQVEVVTPYKDKLKENAIGALHDMCATKEIPIPEYKLVDEKGAPHEKIFTFVCSVSKQRETGVGRTKKQAKQLAAFHMMNRLKESLGIVLKDLQEEQTGQTIGEDFENAVAKYVAAVGTPRKKLRLNRSPSKYHTFFSEISQDYRNSAREILDHTDLPLSVAEMKLMDVDWMKLLIEVLDTLDVDHTFVPGKTLTNDKRSTFLQVDLSTEAVFFGSGEDPEEAMQQAACNALLFLKIHLRNNDRES